LVLSGTGNTATGGTQIGNGILTVNSGSLLSTGALLLAQTSTNNTALNLNNTAQTVSSLASSFTAVTGTQTQVITLGTGHTLTVNQSTNTTYGTGAVATLTSTIAGAGALIKTGAGTLTLSAAGGNNTNNTYSGGTTINTGGSGIISITGLSNITAATINSAAQSVTFSTATPPNGTYQLLPGALTVSTQSFSHNANATKAVTFNYTNSTITVASATITTGTISPTTYCAGTTVLVPFTTDGTLTGTYTAQLSDASGSFTSPVAIGTGTVSPISATVPAGTAGGTGYRIRVVNSGLSITGSDNGSNIIINPILTASVTIAASATTICTGASVTFTATPTNGSIPSYQWFVGATPVGIDSATFTSSSILNNDSITVVMTSNASPCLIGSPATSNAIIMTVGAQSIYSAGAWDVLPTAGRAIVFDDNYNVAANLSGCSCTVNAGKVVTIPSGSSMTLLNGINVDTTNSSTSLTFENTAPLVQINDVANTGKITVKRNSSSLMRLDYTLWSSPVVGQNLLAFSPLTFNQGPSNIRFYTYDTSANYYKVTPPASTSFAYGKGYLIRMPDNHPATPTIWPGQFTGIPNNGSNTAPITYISSTQVYNSIGNRYPSPINLYTAATGFMKFNAANIESTIYFWRKTNSNTANSGYCAYNNGILTVAGSTFNGSDPNGVIQTGQGFLVVAKSGASAVVFNNDMRVASTVNQFNRAAEAEHNTIWLNLTNDNNATAQAAITYRINGTNGIDDYDGLNINDGQISIGSIVNNKNYIIQSRQFPFSETDVVPLIVKTTTSGNHI
jgi:hypothetical protein